MFIKEEHQLLAEIYPHMKRMRWEDEHWDGQIRLYREREQLMESWQPENQALIKRIWHTSFPPPFKPSPYVHILDLHQDGFIRAHLDKPRYCGRVISGLSLLSTSVMRMRHEDERLAQCCVADLLLTRRSLYRLRYSPSRELTATTARYLLVRNASARPVAYVHFRFVEDEGRAVLYCFELQVEPDYQQKGIGAQLINCLEQLANATQMELLMATVFAFNGASLAFFHKRGFRTDSSCRFGRDGANGRDFVILSKQLPRRPDGAKNENEKQKEEAAGSAENGKRKRKK
uniref:N-alpha-acetyltransferase 40 n=1 Tax=Globodera pallida TaxID=36090 RepID=A0A183BJ02_GLOPA